MCKTVKVPWENLLSKYTFVNKADLEVLHCWSGGWWDCSLDRIYNHLLRRERKTRFLGAGKETGSFESRNRNKNKLQSSRRAQSAETTKGGSGITLFLGGGGGGGAGSP